MARISARIQSSLSGQSVPLIFLPVTPPSRDHMLVNQMNDQSGLPAVKQPPRQRPVFWISDLAWRHIPEIISPFRPVFDPISVTIYNTISGIFFAWEVKFRLIYYYLSKLSIYNRSYFWTICLPPTTCPPSQRAFPGWVVYPAARSTPFCAGLPSLYQDNAR